MKKRIAINGFGRIGRAIAKINEEKGFFDLVLINDLNPYIDNMVYLLKYDSTYGRFEKEISCNEEKSEIYLEGKTIKYTSKKNLNEINWAEMKIDILIDSSGPEQVVLDIKKLLDENKIGKAIVTHSSPNVDLEVIVGVNHNEINASQKIFSNSICDANAITHFLKWINEEYGIVTGSVTTLHPWLSYQNLVDGPSVSQSNPGLVWKDYALGRASVDTLIPKNTTAVSAAEKVLPSITGKLASFSYRIPTDIVSSSDIVIIPEKMPAYDELKSFLEKKIKESGYVRANYESLVSLDYEQDEASAIFDFQWLKCHNGLIKFILWYDNEWAYAARALDLAKIICD